MTRETLAALITALQPLLLALITAAAAWGAAAIRRRTTDARYAAAVDTLARGAEAVVADFSQHVVADLRDPSKPGSWDEVTQRALRQRAAARIRALFPDDAAALDRAVGADRANEILGTLVERAVLTQKGGA